MDVSHRPEGVLVCFKPNGAVSLYLDVVPEPCRIYEVRITSRFPTGKEKVNLYRPSFDEKGFAVLTPYNVFCCPVAVVCESWMKPSTGTDSDDEEQDSSDSASVSESDNGDVAAE